MKIATTRFNNETYIENAIWKIKNNYTKCIYGLPHRISESFPPYDKIIVIEMNNDLNLITGIGCIRNYLRLDKKYKIHKNQNLNRYIYEGPKRIDREDIRTDILEDLEYILFKTSKHHKRLRGITGISLKRLGEKLDTDFYIGDLVKKIKGKHIGKKGIVIAKKGDKITVKCTENPEIKFWSSRYALKNYIKLNKEQKKPKTSKKKGKYLCSLCGELKMEHHCIAIIHSEKLQNEVYSYLNSLFKT